MTTELEKLRETVANAEAQLAAAEAARSQEIARTRKKHWPWTFGAAIVVPGLLGMFLATQTRTIDHPRLGAATDTFPVAPEVTDCQDEVTAAQASVDRCETNRTSLQAAPASTKPPCIVGETPCP